MHFKITLGIFICFVGISGKLTEALLNPAIVVKPSCRRVRFPTGNSNVDMVIAIDTNVEACVADINGEHRGAWISDSNIIYPSRTADVIIYKNDFWTGPYETMPLERGECHNVSPSFNDKISSIDTKGACVVIYQHWDCNGNSARLRAGTAGSTVVSKQIYGVRMHTDVSSMELC